MPDTPSQGDFLVRNLTRGSLIGVDPYLYSKTDFDALQNSIRLGGHSLVPVERNLVDLTWSNRPPCPNNPVFPLEVNFTGRTTAQKLDDVRAEMTTAGADAVVLSELDEIACKCIFCFLNPSKYCIHTPFFRASKLARS